MKYKTNGIGIFMNANQVRLQHDNREEMNSEPESNEGERILSK